MTVGELIGILQLKYPALEVRIEHIYTYWTDGGTDMTATGECGIEEVYDLETRIVLSHRCALATEPLGVDDVELGEDGDEGLLNEP